MYPWTNIDNGKLYSFKIENILGILLGSQRKIDAPLHGRKLLKLLTNDVLAINSDSLHKLAPYTYKAEIDELKPTFNISYFSEMTGYGGYHGDGPLIQIILHNSDMLPNVSIEFLASIHGNTIYSRDSVINRYKKIVERVQSIKFITDYLKTYHQGNLHILFFDNKPINEYTVTGVNGKRVEWQKQDEYIESLKWYEKNKITPSFSLDEAIKTSEHNYCGCNYRFSDDFIDKAITFIIDDKQHNHSRWLLLPNNTVLLFLTQGGYNVTKNYTPKKGFEYPCVLFDMDGNIMPKVK